MFMQRRCLHCMRRSYKIRMSWHPIRASNILSQTFNATSVYLLCYTNKLYFHWIRLPGDLTHLTTSSCNILYYASQEMYPHFFTIQKEAVCIETDFQNLSGGACHQNHHFGQSHSSSMVHTMKTKHFCTLLIHRRLLTSICMVDCLTFYRNAKTCHNRDALC